MRVISPEREGMGAIHDNMLTILLKKITAVSYCQRVNEGTSQSCKAESDFEVHLAQPTSKK